jgi:VWFA-related protein
VVGQIAINVSEVGIFVAVTDSDGDFIDNLTQADIQVYEDGEPKELTSFSRRDVPFHVLMVFDCHSLLRMSLGAGKAIPDTAAPKIPSEFVNAAVRFGRSIKSQERLAIAVTDWSDGVVLVSDWNDVKTSSIDLRSACERPNVFDPPLPIERVLSAIERKARSIPGRKAAVWIGAELPFVSNYFNVSQPRDPKHPTIQNGATAIPLVPDYKRDANFQKDLELAASCDCAIYPVTFPLGTSPMLAAGAIGDAIGKNEDERLHRLEAIGRASGGYSFVLRKQEDIDRLSAQLNRETGSSYYLAIKPNVAHIEDGKSHHIQVKGRNPKWKILQSKNTYFSRPASAGSPSH